MIIVVVNLDYHYTQSGWVEVTLEKLGLDYQESYQMHDLLDDARYIWRGSRNYVKLNPSVCPAHVFRVRRHIGSEHNFEYYI